MNKAFSIRGKKVTDTALHWEGLGTPAALLLKLLVSSICSSYCVSLAAISSACYSFSPTVSAEC